MSAGSKLSVALLAVLLAIGLGACGGDDDAGSTGAGADVAGQDRQGAGEAGQSETSPGDAADSSGGGSDDSNGADGKGADGVESKDFVPRDHDDSGGGSQQYITPGADNSVQEFGAEADPAERNAAATAVHNFLDARSQEAWAAACSYLSTDVRESLEEFAAKAQEAAEKQGKSSLVGDTGCAGILANLTNRAALPELRKEAAQADVGSLRLEGDRAFVIYTGLDATVIAIPVVEEDSGWKVGSLAGTPLN